MASWLVAAAMIGSLVQVLADELPRPVAAALPVIQPVPDHLLGRAAGKQAAVFPEQPPALVKFASKPKAWLEITGERPQAGEWIYPLEEHDRSR